MTEIFVLLDQSLNYCSLRSPGQQLSKMFNEMKYCQNISV